MGRLLLLTGGMMIATAAFGDPAADLGHPRLYFTAAELAQLRELRDESVHACIYRNLAESADWCLTQEPRSEWIAPVTPDPIYLNLYDRFYAMMHDMAVMEHLAFAHAYSEDDRYFDGARKWTLACCRVWQKEADGAPDASKAYAVMRLLKGLAVSYDLLYEGLSDEQRTEIRGTLASVGRKYYQWYLDNPGMAGPGQDKHHGSVEAASFGVAALALLGDVPEAGDWLELMVKKHTEHLLPHALTPSGTQEQSSNFWASTMQYRIFFMDALRRVTGRDLFAEYGQYMDGRIALAAVAGQHPLGHNQNNQSILFAPSYGQLDYWAPVLLYLARECRRPIYQHLALWDDSLGSIQKTRYVTSNGEQLLFEMGGYVYAWYDPTVAPDTEPNALLSFEFPDVNEAYARASYDAGAPAIAVRQTELIVHAGGEAVLVLLHGGLGGDLTLEDDGQTASIRSGSHDGPRQILTLRRPGTVVLERVGAAEMRWWCHSLPSRDGNVLRWDSGVVLRVERGSIASLEPEGFLDEKIVGLGKLKCIDPMPMRYPLAVVKADADSRIEIEVSRP